MHFIDRYLFYSFRRLAAVFPSGVSCTLKLSRAFPKWRINFPAINATRDSIGDVINAQRYTSGNILLSGDTDSSISDLPEWTRSSIVKSGI